MAVHLLLHPLVDRPASDQIPEAVTIQQPKAAHAKDHILDQSSSQPTRSQPRGSPGTDLGKKTSVTPQPWSGRNKQAKAPRAAAHQQPHRSPQLRHHRQQQLQTSQRTSQGKKMTLTIPSHRRAMFHQPSGLHDSNHRM